MDEHAQQEIVLKGVGAVPGQALGLVLIYHAPTRPVASRKIAPDEIAGETAKVQQTLDSAVVELQALAEEVRGRVGADEAAIFEAQALMAADPMIAERAAELISAELLPAGDAIMAAAEEQAAILASL